MFLHQDIKCCALVSTEVRTWLPDGARISNIGPPPIAIKLFVSSQEQKKHEFEPLIWSRDTGQSIFSFEKCQLTLTWM